MSEQKKSGEEKEIDLSLEKKDQDQSKKDISSSSVIFIEAVNPWEDSIWGKSYICGCGWILFC